MHSEQINELASALAKAQGAMSAAKMNRINPHFKSHFADLASIISAVRKPLSDNGLSWSQTLGQRDDATLLVTILMHTSGQWIASECFIPRNLKPQEFGSYQTYMRRYSLSAICGIAADEDDDGETAHRANGNGRHIEETGELITPEQIQTLTAALKVREMQPDRLLKWIRAAHNGHIEVKEVADIPASIFQGCLDKVRGASDVQ